MYQKLYHIYGNCAINLRETISKEMRDVYKLSREAEKVIRKSAINLL